ncbi:Hypothetical protein SCF082_LOCUS39498 [Durusdinium trenchii]|uniref:Uncharacterized protein n=1 Tax=Durusdinium trenchii TaxID=1381693 RepID=A0ABP0Q819_9DINO
MSDCWAWGVQQRLAASECAKDVTAFTRCCSKAWVGRERLVQIETWSGKEEEGISPCDAELDMVRRCLPGVLLGGSGRPFEACEKDFRAVATLPSDADPKKAARVFNRGWSCAFRAFRQPVEQLVAQAQAVGECDTSGSAELATPVRPKRIIEPEPRCRPARGVKNAAGKGHWTV